MADVDLGHASAPDELTDLVPVGEDPGCVVDHYASLGFESVGVVGVPDGAHGVIIPPLALTTGAPGAVHQATAAVAAVP